MPAPVHVLKFGGSSVGDAERIRRVARRIARMRGEGVDLVVVVSAMGDTTDELLALAGAITDDPDPRELDVLLATGEHQSATLVSMALHALGVKAISLTGPQAGITTDGRYGRARIAGIDPTRVRAELAQGKVVIVAGFQGMGLADDAVLASLAPEHATNGHRVVHLAEMTTLGRGGSDTTAVALAAQLGADRCRIFTDVRGVYTADPRLHPDARQLDLVGYEEMMELAQQGAQVMQTRAVELGWVNGVIIEVLSSFEDVPGTLIKEDPLVEQRNKVRGLAHDRNVAKITLVEVPDRPGLARTVFEPLADAGINVDMIVQNVGHGGATDLTFTVPARRARRGEAHPRAARPRARLPRADHRQRGRQGEHRRRGHPERAGLCRADVRRPCRRRDQHRDDLDVRDPDHHDHRRGPRRGGGPRASPGIRARAARACRGRGGRRARRAPMTAAATPFLARAQRFASVGSTNDVVRAWLREGTPEVCLAVADEQTAGRGRDGRMWVHRPVPPSCSRSGSARRGWHPSGRGVSRRPSRSPWPMQRRMPPACRTSPSA